MPKPVIKKYRLNVVRLDVNSYAWVDGGDVIAIGQFAASLYNDMTAELRYREIWKLEVDKIEGIKIIVGPAIHDLRRVGGQWTYANDRHLKIDSGKIGDYLSGLAALKAKRFVSSTSADAGKFGLDKPWLELELATSTGVHRIVLAAKGASKTDDRYTMVTGLEGVFLLPSTDVGKLSKLPEDFKK